MNDESGRSFRRLKQVGLVTATAVLAVNVWTGSPLIALWVGSQIQGDNGLSMGAVVSVVVIFGALALAQTWALTWLNAKYDELTGRPATRQIFPWLRSMRGERETEIRREQGTSAIDRVVAISVVAAVLAFEVWFFFFAGSPLPRQ